MVLGAVHANLNAAAINRKPTRIFIAGGSGFIGRKLIQKLTEFFREDMLPMVNGQILCLTRNPESVRGIFADKVQVVKGDISNYNELIRIMKSAGPIDVAYYLVHSMEGDSKHWKTFAERDRKAALNFARTCSECRVKRIIYLGGLSHGEQKELSEHMSSRNEVGEILKTAAAKITIFKAAVILGGKGGSFRMLQYLVERLPVMVCPKWVLTKSQPISVDDVATYLASALDIEETEGKTFEIGGPDILTYVDMMSRYASMLNKKIKILIIPFLTPRLSSYWIDLVTPVNASLARPLIDSLKHEAIVQDASVKRIIPIQLKSFEQSIADALRENAVSNNSISARRERNSKVMNAKILEITLCFLVVVGSMDYTRKTWQDPFQLGNIALLLTWYVGIAFALYFLRQGARLGALVAGLVGWVTMAFWLIDGMRLFLFIPQQGTTTISMSAAHWLNILGLVIVGMEIVASHNVFHKLRVTTR